MAQKRNVHREGRMGQEAEKVHIVESCQGWSIAGDSRGWDPWEPGGRSGNPGWCRIGRRFSPVDWGTQIRGENGSLS